MKKRFIIISAIFATLFSSCTEDAPIGIENSLTGTTTVLFTPDFGEDVGGPDTKAFTDKPQVHNLYLAVFTEGGKALVEYVKANPVTLATDNAPTEYTYTAQLKLSDQPRVIHFIANGPEELNYGSEEDAVGSLLYSFDKTAWTGEDAYWGYLELPDGICKSTDPVGYTALTTAMSGVKLVRNFAKIQVKTASDSNFELTSFWISNFPEQSSAAPYNRDTRKFEKRYVMGDGSNPPYQYATEAMDAGYMGFCPAGSALVSLSGLDDTKLNAIKCDASNGWTAFTYERDTPVKDPLCIIAKGHIKGTSDPDTYYRIDLRGSDGKYIPVLRNFLYVITIGTVEKQGEDTLEDALSSVSSGPIDTNLELQGLKNMSNGTSKISVSETEIIVFSQDDVKLVYEYIPNVNATPVESVNTTLEQLIATGTYADEAAVQAAHLSYVTITREAGPTGAVFSDMTVDSADDTDGARKITLNPVAVDGIIRTEVITITGHFYNNLDASKPAKYETLSRTVNVQMRDKLKMNLKLKPGKIPGQEVGDEIELLIGVEDNLPQSVFTLDMKIETDGLTLTPASDDLPISTAVGSNNKPTYYVTKAITWDKYQKADAVEDADGVLRKYFSCTFKTNTTTFDEFSDDHKHGDTFRVTNEYHQSGSIRYLAGNDAFYDFTNLHFVQSDIAPGRVVDFMFTMSELPEDGEIDVLMYGLAPADSRMFTYKGVDADNFSIYSTKVSMSTETIRIKPTFNINQEVSIKLQKKGEFNNSTVVKKMVTPLTFGTPHLGLGTNDYVVVGREAQAKFNMSDKPFDGNVTIYLKNCTPKDTLSGSDGGNGYTKYVINVDDYAGTQYGYDVEFPVTISTGTGVTKAYFKLTDDEFTPSNEISAPVQKLQFTAQPLANTDDSSKSYLLKNGNARISFSMGDMPLDNKITLALTNLNTPVAVSGVSDISGSGPYTLTVTGTDVVLDVKVGSVSGVEAASYALSDDEFDPATKKADVKTRYTIDWSKVLIKSDDSGNPAQGGVTVSVYTTYNSTTGTCSNEATALGSYQSFTTTNTTGNKGYASATMTQSYVDAASGTDKFYFKFTKDGVDYISEDGVTLATLANTTTTPEVVNVICNIQMVDFTIAAHKLFFGKDAGGLTGYLRFDSGTNTTGQISFTIEEANNAGFKGYNQYAISGQCKPGTKIYFYVNGTSYGGLTIEKYTDGGTYSF